MTREERAVLRRYANWLDDKPRRLGGMILRALDALDTAEREAERQKRHNALLTDTLRGERERRKSVQKFAESLKQQWKQVPPGGGPLVPEELAPYWRERLETAERERDEALESSCDLALQLQYAKNDAANSELQAQDARAALASARREKDVAYAERNKLVAALAYLAAGPELADWDAGIRAHEPDPDPTWDEDWKNVVLIDTPAGQLSWHYHDSDRPMFADLPSYRGRWDGHTSEEKYRRLAAAVRSLGEPGAMMPPEEVRRTRTFVARMRPADAKASDAMPDPDYGFDDPPIGEPGAGTKELAPASVPPASADSRATTTPPPRGAQEGGTHWRVGRKVGRTLYLDDQLVGMVDTPELAQAIVAAMNEPEGAYCDPPVNCGTFRMSPEEVREIAARRNVGDRPGKADR